MKPFEKHLMASWPPANWQDVGVVVAVSGGADSVSLLRALAAVRANGAGRLTVAHFNHRLRGDASDADQRFVETLAWQLGLDCAVEAGDMAPAAGNSDGLEAAARNARYEFLRRLAEARAPGMSPRRIRSKTRPRRSCTTCCAARGWRGWQA